MRYEKPEMIVDMLDACGVVFTSLNGEDSGSGSDVSGGSNSGWND